MKMHEDNFTFLLRVSEVWNQHDGFYCGEYGEEDLVYTFEELFPRKCAVKILCLDHTNEICAAPLKRTAGNRTAGQSWTQSIIKSFAIWRKLLADVLWFSTPFISHGWFFTNAQKIESIYQLCSKNKHNNSRSKLWNNTKAKYFFQNKARLH